MFAFVLLPLVACRQPSGPELLRVAVRAAEAGDPESWSMCERIERDQGRGTCMMAASHALPDEQRGAACDAIVRTHWRSECWFEFAEDLAHERRWDDALAACARSQGHVGDCARHLWWTAQTDGSGDLALHERIVRAFPNDTAWMRVGDAGVRAIAADMRAERTAEWALLKEQENALADERRREWEGRLRETETLDPSACPEDDLAACVAASRAVFAERWRRAAERSPEARSALCEGRGHVGERLNTEGNPELEAVRSALHAELCDALSPGRAPASRPG